MVATNFVLPHDLFSVCSFTVKDGVAAADLLLAGGIAESGGSTGFVKDGAGTMRIEGSVALTGFITVYDGTLDLAKASLAHGVRVNVLGDAVLVPPLSGTPVSEIYVDGLKLVPGTWGPSGSIAAGTAAHESRALAGIAVVPDTGLARREIWKRLKYGIFSHYVWNGYGMRALLPNADGTISKTIDELAEAFDVANYVGQLEQAGVQYVVFTAWHSGTCPLFPSTAMAKWAPTRPSCPRRDLLGDLLDTCRAKGIRTYFYCHPFQPVVEPHNDWINDLFAELVDRYGSRLDGLWLDENFQDCTQDKKVDYRRLMKTIRERNPDLVLTHNNGGHQSYGADEGVQEVQWEFHEGRMAAQYQIFSQTAKSPGDMLITTVIQAAANTRGGGIQWSIDAHGAGANSRGGLDQNCRPLLDGFVKLFNPIADSVKNTSPSTSYPPPFSGAVVKLSKLEWGVATKAHDNRTEYLHVLKPPTGTTLMLPAPADGKVFANARLLPDGRPVSLEQNRRGITLTLPEGAFWSAPDTVIALDVLCPGGAGLVNDTSASVRYRGTTWTQRKNGNRGEFRNDSHFATANGDSFAFTFTGTDVDWISSRGPDRGTVDLAIDGTPCGRVDLSKGNGSFLTVFSKAGLPRGTHTLTGTKRGGSVMAVDAFRVSELINDSVPDVKFLQTASHDSRAAALAGPWEGRGDHLINGSGFSFTFQGTGVDLLAAAAFGSADMVLTLDGKPHSTVRVRTDQPDRCAARITGLANTTHTLAGTYTNRAAGGFQSSLYGFTVTRPDFWSYRPKRGVGECEDDAHVSELKGANGSYTFNGSGVEVIPTCDAESRTAHYTLDGGGGSLWVGLNHYSPVPVVGTSVFQHPNLVPGTYTIGFKNAANSQGVNFSFVRLNIDALRIYRAQSDAATPLHWGADGRGGPGTWEIGGAANWHDGSPAAWLDYGGADYAAVFDGKPGMVTVAGRINVHRIRFAADGYTLRGEVLTLTGTMPGVAISRAMAATIACPISGTAGLEMAGPGLLTLASTNTYRGGTTVNAGNLTVGRTGTLGAGDLTIANGAACQINNPAGALATTAQVTLTGNGKLHLGSGVTEKVARLTVNGTAQPPGIYRADTHPLFIAGAGTLCVAGADSRKPMGPGNMAGASSAGIPAQAAGHHSPPRSTH
jgi:autotransporter-associated beta strand protein